MCRVQRRSMGECLAQRRLQLLSQVCFSTYAACTEPDPGDPASTPFKADAIIAIPYCFGSMDCAEKLGIPLHMVSEPLDLLSLRALQ